MSLFERYIDTFDISIGNPTDVCDLMKISHNGHIGVSYIETDKTS
jgi:hypothetical protein